MMMTEFVSLLETRNHDFDLQEKLLTVLNSFRHMQEESEIYSPHKCKFKWKGQFFKWNHFERK